jgi:CheY-like chemotaxis protein/signal transduction histidine kinase
VGQAEIAPPSRQRAAGLRIHKVSTSVPEEKSPKAGSSEDLAVGSGHDIASSVRPILRAMARLIATDRRAVVLANAAGRVLLANQGANRLGLIQVELLARLDWPELCARVRRAGSVNATWHQDDQVFEGEVVHVPLGPAEGFLLRLAENDHESTWLRNRARSATLMRVSHDLRTPIQSLLASADALIRARSGTDEQSRQIRLAAESALEHISNVLAVIRGEQGGHGGQPDEDFSIAEEVRSLVALVEPIAKARSTELILTTEVPDSLILHGPVRFVRALCQNVIDNSVNHGGGRVEIVLNCTQLPQPLGTELADGTEWRVKFLIRDEGGGLPPAQKARLARALGLPVPEGTPEATGDTSRPSAGLNVLAHALRQLGGHIEIRDRGTDGGALPANGVGRIIGTILKAEFTLAAASFPLKRPASEALEVTPLTGRTLLLVEDSPASREWLTHILQSFGAIVVSAGGGPEALALLSRDDLARRVELILTDVTLPRMSGIDFAARLCAGDPASATRWTGKIVGLTAHADDNIRRACRQAGMVSVLEKPIRSDTLKNALIGIMSQDVPTAVDPDMISEDRDRAISSQAASDLVQRLGPDKARSFMIRALDEAQSVLDELTTEGLGPDTGRRLHAATGASGLTGLNLVEARLRAIERAVELGRTDLADLIADLQGAVTSTRTAAEDLT